VPRRTGSSGWLEWPQSPIRAAVLVLVAVAALVVVVRLPGVIEDLEREASDNSALSYADREVAGGNGVVADQSAVYAARALIPENETYHVAVSPDFEGGSNLTVPYAESYYQYFLMPRRPAQDASWLICYACDLAEHGDGATMVWQGGEGVSIVRIEH